jgi:hypothetical protein
MPPVSTTDAHGPDAAATATETHDEPHGSLDHGDAMDGPDDHAHADEAEPLGPVDWTMWGLGALGAGLGAVVAILMAVSTGAI